GTGGRKPEIFSGYLSIPEIFVLSGLEVKEWFDMVALAKRALQGVEDQRLTRSMLRLEDDVFEEEEEEECEDEEAEDDLGVDNAIRQYLAENRRFPILTGEQEQALAS